MNLTSCPQPRCPRAKIFSFTLPPKTEVENYIDSECQNSGCKFPLNGFDQVVPRIMFGIVNIHTEESNVPLVRRQPQRGIFEFEFFCESRLPRTGEAAYQIEGSDGVPFTGS